MSSNILNIILATRFGCMSYWIYCRMPVWIHDSLYSRNGYWDFLNWNNRDLPCLCLRTYGREKQEVQGKCVWNMEGRLKQWAGSIIFFIVVPCILITSTWHAVHTSQPEILVATTPHIIYTARSTHITAWNTCCHNAANHITMYFHWSIPQYCSFSKAQHTLPEDGPIGPKHVGANKEIF